MPTPIIFISYRREDSIGQAGRLFDRLIERFGKDHVFRDIDTISAGDDFVEAVRQKINKSDILLALIGPRWLSAADEEGRWRLADENDLVRVEISSALERNIRVIPILLQGAEIPKAKDLPGELIKLSQRNAVEIRDTNFDLDTSQLIEKIGPSWRNNFIRLFARRPVYIALIFLIASLLGYWLYPQIAFTPEKARIQIVQMGMAYDAKTFVEKAKNNDVQAVDLFLKAGMEPDALNDPDPNDYGAKGQTALMLASANGHFDLVKKLIEKGADLNKALPWAAGHNQKEIVVFMLEKNPSKVAVNSAMYNAAHWDNTDILQLLLDKGADINSIHDEYRYKMTALSAAAGDSSRIKSARLLLSRGADVNVVDIEGDEPSALFVAAKYFNAEVVDLLLAHGANVNVRNKDNSTPLHEAIGASNSRGDDYELVRLKIIQSLLSKGADLEVVGKWQQSWQPTPLLYAIYREQEQIALLLIEKGANINVKSGYPGGGYSTTYTALMQAVTKGLKDVVKVILTKGADVNARNEEGDSALLIAANDVHGDKIIPILLSKGADASVVNNEGETVLMRAAGSTWCIGDELMLSLIKNGAKIDVTDKNGWTALMHAANSLYERSDVAQFLIKMGANLSPTSDEGENALMIATRKENKRIAKLLANNAKKPILSMPKK